MNKTMRIEGMSCQHCVRAVEGALSKIEGVTNVTVNLEAKTADFLVENPAIQNEKLKAVVEEAGYTVVKID